jgi:hypothetical protein
MGSGMAVRPTNLHWENIDDKTRRERHEQSYASKLKPETAGSSEQNAAENTFV